MLEQVDAYLKPLIKLAARNNPHYYLRDGLLYNISPEGDRVAVP